jgi:hypothetical protein
VPLFSDGRAVVVRLPSIRPAAQRVRGWVVALGVSGALTACSEGARAPDVVSDVILRSVRHTSQYTWTPAFSLGPAVETFGTSRVTRYSSAPDYLSEDDACGIQVQQALNSTTTSVPLEQDSGFVLIQTDANGVRSPTAEANTLFFEYYDGGLPHVVLAFNLPRIAERNALNQVIWPDDYARSYLPGALYPSIWLNSRIQQADAVFSSMAHELGHLLIEAQDPSWNHLTPFLNIISPIDSVRYARDPAGSFTILSLSATDTNRRVLIELDGSNQCVHARRSDLSLESL